MMEAAEIERLIKEAMPDALVELKDLRGDGDHFEARVTSAAFRGLTIQDQHRAVFAALQGRVGGILRILALTTLTPKGED